MLTSQFYVAGEPGNERDGVFRGIRDPRQRELVEMKLHPRPASRPARLPRRWISSSASCGARTSRSAHDLRTARVTPARIMIMSARDARGPEAHEHERTWRSALRRYSPFWPLLVDGGMPMAW